MSDQLKTLSSDKIAALKRGDRTTKDILTLIINEATMIAKNDGNRDVSDADVIQALNRTVKKARETREILVGRNSDTTVQDNEIAVAQHYLPQQMSRDDLATLIRTLMDPLPEGKAAKGMVMKSLNEKHKGAFDPREATAIIDEILVG